VTTLCTPSAARPPHLGEGVDADTIDALCLTASALIARVCGYPTPSASAPPSMLSTAYTLIISSPGGRDLPLPVWPVTAVSSVYDDPSGDFEAESLVDADDYAIKYLPGSGWVLRLAKDSTQGEWTRGRDVIQITFTAGYTNPPEALAQAAIALVRHLYEQRTATRQESASVGGASYSMGAPSGVPDWIRAMLAAGGFILPRAAL
jgi:hypothetical protein